MAATQTKGFAAHQQRVAANFPEGSVEHEVALYHDHIEDNLGDVPADIRRHVEELTRWPDESYFVYIQRIRDSADPVAVAVKQADLRDNLGRCLGLNGGTENLARGKRYLHALNMLSGVGA